MWRLLLIGPLVVAFAWPALAAQFRSAPRSSGAVRMGGGFSAPRTFGGGFRMAPVRPGPMRPPVMRPATFGPRPSPYGRSSFQGGPPMGGRSLDWRHRRRRFFGPSFGLFTYPFAYPYSYIPSFSEYPLFGPDSSSEQSYQAPAETPGAAQDEGEGDSLSGQVQALTDEVEQMRQERGGGSPASSPSAEPTTRADRLPTVFAFRDGRKLEAVNYVIMGKTLWLVGEQTTRRIPLSDLDLAMSKKLNDERGSECPLSDSN